MAKEKKQQLRSDFGSYIISLFKYFSCFFFILEISDSYFLSKEGNGKISAGLDYVKQNCSFTCGCPSPELQVEEIQKHVT